MAIFKPENLSQLERASAASGERHTVMIVDDKEANVSVMAAILRPYFDLIEARDGKEALTLIEAMAAPENLACVISDHRMPRMTGVELFARLVDLLPHTPRILVTGFMDLDALVDAINQGAVYKFIAKPFDAADFLLTVRCAVAAFEGRRLLAAYQHALESQQAPGAAAAGLLARLEAAKQELAQLDAQLRRLQSRALAGPGAA